jgi:hypothetical protein
VFQNSCRHRAFVLGALTLASLLQSTPATHAALMPFLVSNNAVVRFWEVTGVVTSKDFAPASAQMTTRLATLGPGSNDNDFIGLSDEDYDVFYSDANGTFDLSGHCITVEANFNEARPAGGGLNIAAVDLLLSGSILHADILKSFVGLGDNFAPGTELRAVDTDTPIPSTWTTMGNNIGTNQRLRVTVGWTSVPEPGSLALLCGGASVLGASVWRSRRPPRRKVMSGDSSPSMSLAHRPNASGTSNR